MFKGTNSIGPNTTREQMVSGLTSESMAFIIKNKDPLSKTAYCRERSMAIKLANF